MGEHRRDPATALLELDDRGRASLGKHARPRQRYLLTEHSNGTLVLEPAAVVAEVELALLRNPGTVEQIRDTLNNPEQLKPSTRDSRRAGRPGNFRTEQLT